MTLGSWVQSPQCVFKDDSAIIVFLYIAIYSVCQSMSYDRVHDFRAWMSTVSMSCDRVDAFRACMSTVSMSYDRVDAFRAWISTVYLCHATVLMSSGHGCRLCVYIMRPC